MTDSDKIAELEELTANYLKLFKKIHKSLKLQSQSIALHSKAILKIAKSSGIDLHDLVPKVPND